jgi:transcriptional antiterminator
MEKSPLGRELGAEAHQTQSMATEKHYSPADIAQQWGISERTVGRMFANEEGVLEWGRDETLHKRGYKTIRIPESVLLRVHRKLRRKAS